MKNIRMVMMAVLVLGCKTVPSATNSESMSSPRDLRNAHQLFDRKEFFSARQRVTQYLKKHPEDFEALTLLGKIETSEERLRQEALGVATPEELGPDEKRGQVEAALRSAHELMISRRYDAALQAAEKVFVLDPDNINASKLIDDIKKRAYEDGRREGSVLRDEYGREEDERVGRYWAETEKFVAEKRWNMAKLNLEKILLLDPDDQRARTLYYQILNREKERLP